MPDEVQPKTEALVIDAKVIDAKGDPLHCKSGKQSFNTTQHWKTIIHNRLYWTKCLKIKSIFLSLSSISAWPYKYLYRLTNTNTVIPNSAEFFCGKYHTLAETVVYEMSLTTMLSKYEYSTTKPGLGSSLKFHTSVRLNPEEWFVKSMYNKQ